MKFSDDYKRMKIVWKSETSIQAKFIFKSKEERESPIQS